MDWFESWFNTLIIIFYIKTGTLLKPKNFIDKLLAEIRLPQHSTIIDWHAAMGDTLYILIKRLYCIRTGSI